eukprot:scaffold267521_cov35-Attheya_sp.AAC.1
MTLADAEAKLGAYTSTSSSPPENRRCSHKLFATREVSMHYSYYYILLMNKRSTRDGKKKRTGRIPSRNHKRVIA